MSDLSQNEVDQASEDLNKTKESSEKLESTPFDFSKSNRVPKEQTKTIELIHNTFAQTAGFTLSAQLGCDAEIHVESVEQNSFHQYIKSIPNPSCIAIIDMPPLSGYAAIEINPVLVFPFIDRMLGGSGEAPSTTRSFTDLEIAVSRKFVEIILKELSNAWATVLNLNFSIIEMHTNPAFIRSIAGREACVNVSLMTKIDSASGLITLAIPYANLEPIANKLSNEQWNTKFQAKQPAAIEEAHKKNFSKIKLDLEASLGTLEVSMQELLSLEPGDILELNQKVSEPISVKIQGEEKFKGLPGLSGKHKAISIQQEVEQL